MADLGRLDPLLAESGAVGLVVLAESSADPWIAPFVSGRRLGRCLLVARPGAPPLLAATGSHDSRELESSGARILASAEALGAVPWHAEEPLAKWSDVVPRALRAAELPAGRVLIAGSPSLGELVDCLAPLRAAGWHLSSGQPLLERLRRRKSPQQMQRLREACGVLRQAYAAAAELVRTVENGAAVSATDLGSAVSEVLYANGLEEPEGRLIAVGDDASRPHGSSRGRRCLRAGEMVLIDLFPRHQLFVDCTRVLVSGRPSAALARAHRQVHAVLLDLEAMMRPGIGAAELHEAACDAFAALGVSTLRELPQSSSGFSHGLGHGVGFELHEAPSFRPAAKDRIEEGDVFTLEPAIYAPREGFGVRLENLYCIAGGVVENLTPFPLGLEAEAWS